MKSVICIAALLATATVAEAQPLLFVQLHAFTAAEGSRPTAPLIEASDGNLYGTTTSDGNDGGGCMHFCGGTIFRVTRQGQLSVLHTFAFGDANAPWANGKAPAGELVEGPDGFLYGVTSTGGYPKSTRGIVYKIRKDGSAFQKLYDFCQTATCADGETPVGGLAVGRDGQLYGVTSWTGQIYKISTTGAFTLLYKFRGNLDGGGPVGSLVLGRDGNFYGACRLGVYRVSPAGGFTLLYKFGTTAGDGTFGVSPLAQALDGTWYGVNDGGGANGIGTIFKIRVDGSGSVTYQKLADLIASIEGVHPNALRLASDGNLWGTTTNTTAAITGGALFTFTTAGAAIQSVFLKPAVGTSPSALIQGSDGKLYATAFAALAPGGGSARGSVFAVDAGLDPSITTVTLASSVPAATYGQTVSLTATVVTHGPIAPTGTVRFEDGATTIAIVPVNAGGATLNLSTLSPGVHSIVASYSGDVNFHANPSTTLAQTIATGTTKTAITPSVNPSRPNQAVTFAITVTSPFGGPVSGRVTIREGTTAVGTVDVINGQATFTRTYEAAQAASVTAVYSGDVNNLGSTSALLRQTIK